MVSCGSSIVKILLGLFNLIWLALGGGVIYIGYRLVKFNNELDGMSKISDINLQSTSIVILGIGIVIALISFLGFTGACCENGFMLNAYGFLMILMIGAQIYAIVVTAKNNGNIEDEIKKGITDAIGKVKTEPHTAYFLELFQYTAKCCGWKDWHDFNVTKQSDLPGSCCGLMPKSQDTLNPTCGSNSFSNDQGCSKAIHFDELGNLFKGTIAVGVAIVLFELILVFAACCLAREVRYK